jgi:hypothetical protein
VGSRGQSNSREGSLGEQQYESNLRSARTASNSAISSFYKSPLWHYAHAKSDEMINLEIASMLQEVRHLVDGGVEDENDCLFFHDVVVAYNNFLSCLIQIFVLNEVSYRKTGEQRRFSDPKTGNESRRNAKVALSLLDLILSFVKLKESLGMERATLSGLMVIESIDVTKSTNDCARLNIVVNDLVMVVENQHQIMRDLRKQSGLSVFGSHLKPNTTMGEVVRNGNSPRPEEADILLDGNYCALIRLVGDSIRPSDAMLSLQEHIRKDFDIDGFRRAMPMDEFWYAITLYMDRLHAMELFILEEMENCEGSYDNLDLLSLHDEKLAQNQRQQSILPPRSSRDEKRPELEEWEIR